MYYIGVDSRENSYSFFITLMHRKTAKRVYEPTLFETYKEISKDELRNVIKNYYGSKEFILLKKKFSQSGRPPRKVITPPYFIISDDEILEDILKNLRVSYTKIVFNEEKKSPNSIFTSKEILYDSLDNVIKEKRTNFDKLLNTDIENIVFQNSFALVAFYNEVRNKRIKRY